MGVLNKLRTSARTTETDAVSRRIIVEYDKSDWSFDTHLTGIFNVYRPASQKLSAAINRTRTESMMEEKDEIRDAKIRAIHFFILGFMQHPDETIKGAAEEVDLVFEKYGVDVARESYSNESSLIESLLGDFADLDLQSSIAALPGLSELIDQLRAAQTDFEDTKILYEEEQAILGNEANATEIKKEVLDILNNQLVTYLRAMIQVDEAKYGLFTRTISEFIDDMNEQIKARRKDSASALDG